MIPKPAHATPLRRPARVMLGSDWRAGLRGGGRARGYPLNPIPQET